MKPETRSHLPPNRKFQRAGQSWSVTTAARLLPTGPLTYVIAQIEVIPDRYHALEPMRIIR